MALVVLLDAYCTCSGIDARAAPRFDQQPMGQAIQIHEVQMLGNPLVDIRDVSRQR